MDDPRLAFGWTKLQYNARLTAVRSFSPAPHPFHCATHFCPWYCIQHSVLLCQVFILLQLGSGTLYDIMHALASTSSTCACDVRTKVEQKEVQTGSRAEQ